MTFFFLNLVLSEILLKGTITWKSWKMLTGSTINNVPSGVFLNFGVQPQSAVSRIQDLKTDYSKMKKKLADDYLKLETCGEFSKRYKTLWKK